MKNEKGRAHGKRMGALGSYVIFVVGSLGALGIAKKLYGFYLTGEISFGPNNHLMVFNGVEALVMNMALFIVCLCYAVIGFLGVKRAIRVSQ